MSKRNRGNRNPNGVFGSDTPDSLTTHEVDASIFGAFEAAESRYLKAQPIQIDRIQADALQPRRAIPNTVRQTGLGLPDLLQHWHEIAQDEAGQEINPQLYFQGDPDQEEVAAAGYIEASFLKIVSLAASIRRDGLTNPITVCQTSAGYIIETGERRWLAYHMLNLLFPEEDWYEIPARVVSEVSIWRQAAENNARDDLNAIARARQLALIIMDLYARMEVSFKPAGDFQHEREYYAQVQDGNDWRIPRGKGQDVLNACGFKSMSQLRDYRRLLRLDNETWDAADDLDLTEFELRSSGYTVSKETVSSGPDTKSGNDQEKDFEVPVKKYVSFLERQTRKLKSGKTLQNSTRAEALSYVQELRRYLDDLEEQLSENS